MRRHEFENNDPQLQREVLTHSKICHLGFQRDGDCEVLPYNFVLDGDFLNFHSSPKTGLAQHLGGQITALTYDTVTWIPSTWRHPNLACPATTYYRSASIKGKLEEVTNLRDKARSLELFMRKYQPTVSYTPLEDPIYEGPLEALFVGRLSVKNLICKIKMGQHLTPKQRLKVHKELRKRSEPGDRLTAQAMVDLNSDLQNKEEIQWRDALTPGQFRSLSALLGRTYWAKGRTPGQLERLLNQTEILVAGCSEEEVVAFARVSKVSDGWGYIADVVVQENSRGQGLGKLVLSRLLNHPHCQEMTGFTLLTSDAQGLYEKFGFETVAQTGSDFMLKMQEPAG